MKLKLSAALLAVAALLLPLSLNAGQAQNLAETKSAAAMVYGKLPLSFEPTADSARFVAHSGGYTVSIGARESSVAVVTGKSGKSQLLRFAFDNAGPSALLQATEPQKGVTNYYTGTDSTKWRLGVKSYAKVRSQGVYPGIDVIYYGDHRRLEFDFVVAPKADPSAIALSFSGMEKLYKDAAGDLVAEVGGQPVRLAKPYAYQKTGNTSKPVAADYELAANGKIHLRLGAYDRDAELIVDPVVSYATYLGGSQTDVAKAIAVDGNGFAYVTGETCSSDFASESLSLGSFTGTPNTSCDAYVTKFSPDGTTFEYTTFIGGTNQGGYAIGNGIALDASSPPNVYIAGTTNFTNLPNPDKTTVYTNNLNTWQGGDSDAFIAILDSGGSVVRLSYLGGIDADAAFGIAVDTTDTQHLNNVIVVGETCGIHEDAFPRYNGFETKVEFCAAFITKLDNGLHIGLVPDNGASAWTPMAPRGTPPYYFSEFFAGLSIAPAPTTVWLNGTPYASGAIVLDNNNPPNVQIALNAGVSNSTGLPPLWSTGVKGLTTDGGITWENVGKQGNFPFKTTAAYGVALDPLGDVFVAGGTNTADLGTSAVPYGPYSYNHGTGAWVLKVNGGQTTGQPGAYVYATALQNTPADSSATIDVARAIAVDIHGTAYVTGTASGTLFTTASSYQPALDKGTDAFLAKMDFGGGATPYVTYLGGSGDDQGLGVAVDSSGAAYVTGSTKSTDFPTINPLTFANGTPMETVNGPQDAFVTKFTPDGSGLVFSAYLGGSDIDQGNAIATMVDPNNSNFVNMYVAGNTYSTDLQGDLDPVSYTPPQPGNKGNGDAFVAMIAGSSLPIVAVTPGTLSFPPQDVFTSSVPLAIEYTNTNLTSTVTIKSITFDSNEFSQFPKAGSVPANCTTGVVQPKSACDIWVVFTPSGQQSRTGHLTIKDDATSTSHVLTLTGTGTAPQDAFSASSLTFAAQALGTSSDRQLITLQNIGTGNLLISGSNGIVIGGADPGAFSQTNNCGTQLLVGDLCSIYVTFSPSASGLLTANLTITDNAQGSPHVIGLNGTGGQSSGGGAGGGIVLSQSAVSFGQVGASSTKTVTLTNSMATALAITNIAVTGNSDFAIVTNIATNCPTTFPANLAAGAACQISLTFTPTTTTGTETATLTVTGNASNSPQTVALSGSGTPGTTSTAPFTVTPQSPGGVSTTEGNTAQYMLSVAPLNNFTGSVGFTCSGPSGSTCSISPNPLPMDGTTIKTVTLSVKTTGGNGSMAAARFGTRSILLALLPFSMMGMLLFGKRRSYMVAFLLVALCMGLGIVSCGSGSSTSSTSGGLAPGTYQVTVTATSSTNASQSQTFTLPLVVTKQ